MYMLVLSVALITASCKNQSKEKQPTATLSVAELLDVRYQKLLAYPLDSLGIPRSYDVPKKETRNVASKDWTSGFFAGNLWQLHQLTGNSSFLKRAEKWTAFLEKEKDNKGTHDTGFKIFCSFGEGYAVSTNEHYKDVIVASAKTLCTRYNSTVGSLRSWDFNKDVWEFPVIVDNMMNLELLFEATKISGDSTYHTIAVSHANTTLKNHFREDNSSYHVVVYDTLSGSVNQKVTHQGLSDNSAWARGQAWGIYGFTMAYRYTKNPAYLKQAQESINFYLNHPKLRADGIPYWDFDDPKIPNAPRDVSAATIIASACYELANYTTGANYVAYADKVLATLQTADYILSPDIDTPFILNHSTGHWPKKDEMDGPIVYADYYFLEALLRQKERLQ